MHCTLANSKHTQVHKGHSYQSKGQS